MQCSLFSILATDIRPRVHVVPSYRLTFTVVWWDISITAASTTSHSALLSRLLAQTAYSSEPIGFQLQNFILRWRVNIISTFGSNILITRLWLTSDCSSWRPYYVYVISTFRMHAKGRPKRDKIIRIDCSFFFKNTSKLSNGSGGLFSTYNVCWNVQTK